MDLTYYYLACLISPSHHIPRNTAPRRQYRPDNGHRPPSMVGLLPRTVYTVKVA